VSDLCCRRRTRGALAIIWGLAFALNVGIVARGDVRAFPRSIVRLRVGDTITERTSAVDRVDWRLPKARLERFRAAGVIIDEEQRVTITAQGEVVRATALGPVLHVRAEISSLDVPRQSQTHVSSTATLQLGFDNQPRSARYIDVADAAMIGLPQTLHGVGQRWRTRLAVDTTLGHGEATFDHEIVACSNGLVQIDVHGHGTITGLEYHLPKLLPGTIGLLGSAWLNPRLGIVTQESYAIHNTLLKPAEGEQIGFDERRTLDATAQLRKVGQGPG
jgi:hypothetical protein